MAGHEFVFDEGGDTGLETAMALTPRWRELPHAPERTRAFIMVPGERLATPWLTAETETSVWLQLARGLPEISDDGLEVGLWLERDGGEPQPLLTLFLDNQAPDAGKQGLSLPLPLREGEKFRVSLRCGPGPRGEPDADWLAVVAWVVGRLERLPLLRARSHARWRLANELAHFSGAYDQAFYAGREVDRGGDAAASGLRRLPEPPAALPAPDLSRLQARLTDTDARPGENAFGYAHRLLRQLLPLPDPDFAGRLRALQARRPDSPLRMLSLCAGRGAVEGALLESADVPVHLCLVDVNESLLERAAAQMPGRVKVERVLGSVDAIGPALGAFDVVNITSGLHHLVELERVLAAIAALLAPGGEFWLIGEQVGRNGNRLWPEAREAADAVFSRWPEDKRRNRNTGQVDARLPDIDHAASSFEGIRSQDILAQLSRHFLPLDVHVADAFLWRLVDAAYAGNFDLAVAADRQLLQEAVLAEARHWLDGGRGTALNGAWRAKRDLLGAPT